ncbi:MAG: DUF1501 domain-containing protein [Planctomycetota bacterium]
MRHDQDARGTGAGRDPLASAWLTAPITRRSLLQAGVGGAVSWLCLDPLARAAAQQKPPPASQTAPARSIIQIWMWGGPSHLDTFDPKPEAGRDFCGPLVRPLRTNVKGILIGEMLPLLAEQADKYAIIRSMTHSVNGHETASYMVQTGHPSGDGVVYPCAGAVASYFRGYGAGYKGLVPPYVVLTEPQGRFSEAGFLGPLYKPFATGGDPARGRFEVEGVVAPGISDERQKSRRDLLKRLDAMGRALQGDPNLAAFNEAGEQAYDLILGDAGKVFDLSLEPDELRERYGRNTFGQSCLVARRLAEVGVPYITINYGGWDTHKEHFETMRRKLPELDRGMGTLLADLSERGLLDSTIVWWGGEFGRTPRVQWEEPWNGGRGHFGQCFSMVVAGGGFKGGHVVGASNATGEEVAERPVYPWDLIASIYEWFGIDPAATIRHPQGNEIRITPSENEVAASGGRLREIMPKMDRT